MSSWKMMLLAGAMAFAPAQAFAAPEEAPEAEIVAPAEDGHAMSDEAMTVDAKARMQKEIDAAIAMIEKIFGTDKLPPIAPAQLALAQATTTALVPPGSLEKMLDNLYGKLFKGLMDEFGGTSDVMLSIKTGVDSEKIAALDDKSKAAVADMFDPARQQREDQITQIAKPLISEILSDLEGPMRNGLAHAYARKFSADQLSQMNGFFATPAGGAFASEWMALQADPEVMLAMIKAVPPLMNKFIDRGPEIEGQLKDLPKEKQLADLSDPELAKLAKLMKVSVKELKEHRDQWDAPVEVATEAVEAADAAADAADDASTEAAAAADAAQAAADATEAAMNDPAHDRANWSDADRQRVEQLEEAANAASSAAYDAEEQAVANARKKTPPQ
ncbi:hypothetical protein CVO77_15020 [Sphingopyxis lindanitolerans]|uniref:DUF2059 domain-containing protein n=1 Tax=Sphingopyxis lindanitolerans TaxID=2054227 RepID=A0A2S8B4I7_9SPHN|nr:DUF2059 domain-containing protein [Sphingopyxis lindanitolerans]PQM27226.1 hypothetical protein CVO77_15020 [Sphingopyxis lindanitolerans]